MIQNSENLAADPARKLCLDNQFIVVHADGNTTCEDCGPCPPGQQHSHVCGGHIYPNASLVCELCPENTFSSHQDTSRCVPCSSCAEGQVVLHSCTKTQDVACEKKCSGRNSYFDESGFCLPCSKCCGDSNDKVEDECKSKLGAASENVCRFNQSRNLCDIESTTPTTVATAKSTEITQNTTSTLNVTGSPTLTSKRSFASTSVSKQSTSGHSERIISIVLPIVVSFVSVTFFLYLAASIRKVRRTWRKCNQLHRGIRDVEAGILEAGPENIPMAEMRKNTETAVLVETGRAVGSREDVVQEVLEEEEEQKKGSNEPLLGKLEPGVQRKCAEERLSKANKELVAAEGGQTSGLLDEGLDQEELGVGEREESKGEEEEDDQQQEHGKLLQGAYCSCQKEKKAEKVSKPLGDLYNDSSDILKKVRESLDTPIRGLGSVEDVAKHYLFDVVTVRSRFQTSPDGPSDALISGIIAKFPDETVESFARVVVKRTKRQNVAKLLREFDLK
ncbi:PREDICTED: uncharacterized protein LOC107350629 [Acropora digitifera]|uniref:uncharacterized protein LOC107350629 n=1 Tax=Acropora digitifera TaxID=70779 RepID=UPI00077A73D7|nr:PREDICTED: uncharacterized protein LOC107350629 [Acropora digitifera]